MDSIMQFAERYPLYTFMLGIIVSWLLIQWLSSGRKGI